MSWQDDLKQLDQALADGRISADGYREGRDKILAAYATGTTPSGPQPPAQPQQPQSQQPPQSQAPQGQQGQPQTQQPQQNQGPFAPPFRWTSTSPAEATQVVANQPPGNAEATQVVPTVRPDNPEATQVVNRDSGASERTQAFRPVGAPGQGQQGGQQWPPQQQQQWSGGQDSAPPWGSDSGMIAPKLEWLTQGPEVFNTTGGGNGRKITLVVGIVVLIGLIVGALFVFKPFGGSNQQAANQTTTTRPAPTTPHPTGPPKPLAGLDGQVDSKASGSITVAEAVAKHQFSPDEATAFAGCQATSGQDEVVYRETWYTQVHVFRCQNASGVDQAIANLNNVQTGFGFTPFNAPDALSGMLLTKATDVPDAPVDARVFYASGNNIVRVEIRGHTTDDVNAGLAVVTGVVTKNYPAK